MVQLDESQLAEAVAPHTVQWLCQHQLKEPLELLATKLGQAPSTLLLGAADAVIAHMLWFSLDSLERFTQFVESVMHPETFIAVVTVSSVLTARLTGSSMMLPVAARQAH